MILGLACMPVGCGGRVTASLPDVDSGDATLLIVPIVGTIVDARDGACVNEELNGVEHLVSDTPAAVLADFTSATLGAGLASRHRHSGRDKVASVVIRHLETSDIRPFRRAEYDRLVELGVFEGERVELIDGLIVRMSPHGPRHDGTIDLLVEVLSGQLGERARVRVQSAFIAGDRSEPEPDIAVVPRSDYRVEHPRQAYLLIEIAESSLERVRGAKALLYAGSGVAEYWVVDVAGRGLEVFREPTPAGYRNVQRVTTGVVRMLEFPDVAVDVEQLF